MPNMAGLKIWNMKESKDLSWRKSEIEQEKPLKSNMMKMKTINRISLGECLIICLITEGETQTLVETVAEVMILLL